MIPNGVKVNSTEGKCQRGNRKLQNEVQPCQKITFDNMTEELQADYFDRYEGFQAWKHLVSQFDESTNASTTYLVKTEKTRKNVIKAKEQFSIMDHSTTAVILLYCTE